MKQNLSKKITFCLSGIAGKMGREVVKNYKNWNGIELVSALGLKSAGKALKEIISYDAPDIIIGSDLQAELVRQKPDVLLDFTHPDVALAHALCAIENGVAPIIGTSGLQAKDLEKIHHASCKNKIPAMVVPNFSVGACLGMKFAELAIQWLHQAEIIEAHHEQKLDAPSGTALETARLMNHMRSQVLSPDQIQASKNKNTEKFHDIPIHSIRLKGFMAEQRVIFGGMGETLEIKHTVIDRSVYMSGVEIAIRAICSSQQEGLILGLNSILMKKVPDTYQILSRDAASIKK